jgi:hypothetical protein
MLHMFVTSRVSSTLKVRSWIPSHLLLPAKLMNSTLFVKAFLTSSLSTEKPANNTKRKYLISELSSWPPPKVQLVYLPILGSTLDLAPSVFLRLPLGLLSHIQSLSWEGLCATLLLIAIGTVNMNGSMTGILEADRECAPEPSLSIAKLINALPHPPSLTLHCVMGPQLT